MSFVKINLPENIRMTTDSSFFLSIFIINRACKFFIRLLDLHLLHSQTVFASVSK